MLGMVRFLMNRPTCDQIAEHIVLNLLADSHARTVVISQFGGDGSLHLLGSFGLSDADRESYRMSSMWDHTPLGDSVRSGTPLVIPDVGEVSARYPDFVPEPAAARPVAVWPLTLPQERVGALLVTFDGGLDAESLLIDVSGLAAVLALYLSVSSAAALKPARVTAPERAPAPKPSAQTSPETRRLSERQTAILELIAHGMTNPQISHRIGFSESTVRQESMQIYRFLGVNSRRDAVRVARTRGLLADAH